MNKRYFIERKLQKEEGMIVVGCDEVGRGPLAGPVVAAAVGFSSSFGKEGWWNKINDSKMLNAKTREELSKFIKANSEWGIGVVSSTIIDRINIHQASLLAMKKAVAQLQNKLGKKDNLTLLLDGRFAIPNLPITQKAIIGGDATVHSIAAASILAKVHRDKLMIKAHNTYPEYGMDKHKGYGTAHHREAIIKQGLSPVHRISFCGKIV